MRSGRYLQSAHEGCFVADAVPVARDFSDDGDIERVILSPSPLARFGAGARYFHPDEDETLFLQLLSVDEQDEQALAAAAGRMGFLMGSNLKWYRLPGVNPHALRSKPLSEGLQRRADQGVEAATRQEAPISWVHAGERVSLWRHQIIRLRDAWRLWIACREGDTSFLASRIVWPDQWLGEESQSDQIVYLDPSWGEHHDAVEIGELADFHPGDLVEPALRVVSLLVKDQIGRLAVDFSLDRDANEFAVTVTPVDFLSAIWLQLADAIQENREYRRCEECGKWFRVVSQGGSRRNFCSDACRVRAYRRRKKERSG